MSTFDDLQQRHHKRRNAPEAAMGEPNFDFLDAFGRLQVPYLSPSWREIELARRLSELEFPDQARAVFSMLHKRLPELDWEDFLDECCPEDFAPWWIATNAPRQNGEVGEGKPTGRGSLRFSPYRSLLSAG